MEPVRGYLLIHLRDNFKKELDDAFTSLNLTVSQKFNIILQYKVFIEKLVKAEDDKKLLREVWQGLENLILSNYPKQFSQLFPFLYKYFDSSLSTYILYLDNQRDKGILHNNILDTLAPNLEFYTLNDREFDFLIAYINHVLIDKRNDLIKNSSSNEELLGPVNTESASEITNEMTTRERVEFFLKPLREKGQQGTAIVDESFFTDLVNAYVNWIDDSDFPEKANRHRFHGSNKEFYSVLNRFHKECRIKIKGIGFVLTYHLTMNNDINNKEQGIAPGTIEKNIRINHYKTE